MNQQRTRTAWLLGGAAQCQVLDSYPESPKHLVLLGAPGVGKGTQAELLSESLGACHLSTGDVFRAAGQTPEAQQGPAIKAALQYMRSGRLVPDDTVLDIVRERSACLACPCGFLMDGFPRTVAQAEAFDGILKSVGVALDAVISYDLPLQAVVERLSGRRTCPACKAIYHLVSGPPKQEGICDKCGQMLIQREDDRPESITVRLEAYDKSTAPLIGYYRQSGILLSISAEGAPSEIFDRTMAALSGS